MPTETPNTSAKPQTIEGDRGAPSVAGSGNGRNIMVALFLIISVLAIGFVLYDGMRKKDHVPQSQIKPLEFQAPSISEEPYIEPQTLQKSSSNDPAAANISDKDRELMLAEAMRLAEEQKKKREERLRSPQLVYDNGSMNFSNGLTGDANNENGNNKNASNPLSALGGNLGGRSNRSESTNTNAPLNAALNIATDAYADAQKAPEFPTAKASFLSNPNMMIAQGKLISGILETAIHSELPGLVRAVISEDIYAFDSSQLLVPKGSRLIGNYGSQTRRGQSRILVIWSRLIRPDGASIKLNSKGSDSLGRTGVSGEVDNHFMQRFGASILLSIIDEGLRIAGNSIDDNDSRDITVNTQNAVRNNANIALRNSINIKPTIHVQQGERIKIMVARDLDFSDVGAVKP